MQAKIADSLSSHEKKRDLDEQISSTTTLTALTVMNPMSERSAGAHHTALSELGVDDEHEANEVSRRAQPHRATLKSSLYWNT